jgi:pectate lyase
MAAPAAFPGALGYGAVAKGGRGGKVIQVTNLNDSGAGSLRNCIIATGPRTCVFRVSGVIRFTTASPAIRNPYITIAGETAPGGGILLTHAGGDIGRTPLIVKGTNDVVIRHIRVRMDRAGTNRAVNDGILIQNSRNVILDHVSTSWAQDENFNTDQQTENITISNSIFAEGVKTHDKCALIGSHPTGPQKISFVRNICASNGDRNPDINLTPGSCMDIVNNVMYNANSQFAEIWESEGGSPVNIVGNYFKKGPNTSGTAAAVDRQTIGSTGKAKIYLEGNQLDGIKLQTASVQTALVSYPVCWLPPRLSASTAYTTVLASAGAFPRDSVDTRIVDEVKNRGGNIRSTAGSLPSLAKGTPYVDSDKDGMSDAWERSQGLSVGVNDAAGDKNGNGWTNLDEFLDFAHRQVSSGKAVQ